MFEEKSLKLKNVAKMSISVLNLRKFHVKILIYEVRNPNVTTKSLKMKIRCLSNSQTGKKSKKI